MALVNLDELVDPTTGERSLAGFRKISLIRARIEYGGYNPPYCVIRKEWKWCEEIYSNSLRYRARENLGLPDDRKMMDPELAAIVIRNVAAIGVD